MVNFYELHNMKTFKRLLVIILLLNIFCISIGKADYNTIENPEELTFYEELQQQFTEFKILRMRDKMKFETEIKSLKTKFQNFEELHLADKTEILNLKSEVKSLTNKILAVEGDLKPDSWMLQPLVGPPGGQGQKGDSGERGERGQSGERGFPGPNGLTGELGVQGQKGDTGDCGPMGPGGPEGKPGMKGDSGERGPKGEIGLPGMTGPKGPKGDAGIPGEFPVAELNKINETSKRLAISLRKLDLYSRTCNEMILHFGPSQSKQIIYPNGRTKPSVEVLCDYQTEGGAWTIIQKRSSGPKEEFARGLGEYEWGFGSLDGNFWIGLKTIHALTKDGDQELRIDLWDFEGGHAFAKYSNFSISDSSGFYRLTVGGYSGTAGDSLRYHNRHRFSSNDKDIDASVACAENRRLGWWYSDCGWCNLNGLYYEKMAANHPYPSYNSGMYWFLWKDSYRSLRQVEMRIRSRL